MKFYEFRKNIIETKPFVRPESGVWITNSKEADDLLSNLNIHNTEKHDLNKVAFCKSELHHEYLECSLCIPDIYSPKSKNKIQYYITKDSIVFIDNTDYVLKIIEKMHLEITDQTQSKERFLYDFYREILSHDMLHLENLEEKIMNLEDAVISDSANDFQQQHTVMRKNLLILRSYYEGLTDMFKNLEENDNEFFDSKNLNYFEIIDARAERLFNRSQHLLEYLTEIRETYLEIINDKQNRNMNYLTIISTLFLPLTLITGWFGMNFERMPGLKHGYPFTVAACLIIVAVTIYILKKKKWM